jgi:UDP-3-O-[3-hydroxymyristoyl] N-acetylglucosamine deacetylase
MYRYQQTLSDAIVFRGLGVHTGNEVRAMVRPAPANTGYVLRMPSQYPGMSIPVHIDAVRSTAFATTLGNDQVAVSTVEHLLSALVALEVDNAFVDLNSDEFPIMDGSALQFVQAIDRVGLCTQNASKLAYYVQETIRVGSADRWIEVSPNDSLVVDFTLEYDHPTIGKSQYIYEHSPENFRTQIAAARTFIPEEQLQGLQANGLGKGGSLDNAVVATQTGVANPAGLRFENEFVRHKILDVLGDFSLLGGAIVGKITACRSGHATNCDAFRQLIEQGAGSWQQVRDIQSA